MSLKTDLICQDCGNEDQLEFQEGFEEEMICTLCGSTTYNTREELEFIEKQEKEREINIDLKSLMKDIL